MNIEKKQIKYQMSGQEEQQQQQQQQQQASVDNIMDDSIMMPIANSNILDILYLSGLPISPFYGGAAGGGLGLGNQYNEMEQAMASILIGSLYERNPIKKVFDAEAASCVITDKKFTTAMVEEMKINNACGIWQEDFEEGEDIKILPCNHAFRAEAIMKWLNEEKAECPMCRFVLKSKELICRENEEGDSESDSESDEYAAAAASAAAAAPQSEPALNNNAVRVNNIASRLAQSVAGRANHVHNNLPQDYEESISVPISRLIESRRNMILQSRNVSASRAAMPSMGGGAGLRARAAASYANAHNEVRAEAIQRAAPMNNNNLNNNPPILNIINNNYYYNRNMNMNVNRNDNDNNNINNYINNYNDDEDRGQDIVSNQELADIEEAIRRSLE